MGYITTGRIKYIYEDLCAYCTMSTGGHQPSCPLFVKVIKIPESEYITGGKSTMPSVFYRKFN